MRPTVSVIVPVYNDAPYVATALGSLREQTMPDFEVVMSDDSGVDGATEICRAWAEKDDRFRLIQGGAHVGMTRNWNRGLAACRGEYVVKLDADDVMRPRCLEVLLGELERDPSICTAFCRTLDCDHDLEPYSSYLGERVFHRWGLDPLVRHVKRGLEWHRLCFDGYQLWTSNAQMHRRTLLEKIGGWDERWGCAADTDLILRILELDGVIVHHPYCGIWYRRHPGSVNQDYEAQGWKAIEASLIYLGSLRRRFRSGKRMGVGLLGAWFRHWEAWQRMMGILAQDRGRWPPGLRGADITLLTKALYPPISVRVAFGMRRAVGLAARRLRNLRSADGRAGRDQAAP